MRNTAIIASILFAAVACDRNSTTGDERAEPTRVTGTTGGTGPSGSTTSIPGVGQGATGASETLGATDTIGTVDHIPNGNAGGAGAGNAAARTGDGNSATMANGTRTGTMGSTGAVDSDDTDDNSDLSAQGARAATTGSHGTVHPDDTRGTAANPGNTGDTGHGAHGATAPTAGQLTGPSGGIAPSTGHSVSCAQLIPPSVQRQYLANMTITPTSPGTDMGTSCQIKGRGVDAAAQVQAWCNHDEDNALQPDSPASVPGSKVVGKAAILVDAGELQQLTAWDSDSSCQITLAVPKTVDAMALGRRMLDALPAKSIVGSRDDG